MARRRRDLRDCEEGLAIDIVTRIRELGPLTVAQFMEHALYDSDTGYYARAAQRTGRAGDFFTSVDVGPLFGDLLAKQVVEMAAVIQSAATRSGGPANGELPFDLVEAGAGNGRLSADIVRGIRRRDVPLYERLRLHLVEASAAARAAHGEVLGEHARTLVTSAADLPARFTGVLFANELLDALPVHQVTMREDGLREVFVHAVRASSGDWKLVPVERQPSTPELSNYLRRLDISLEPGWRVEINLRAVDWVSDAVRRLERGFVVLVDYGHLARELYSVTHAGGTLTTFSRHTVAGPEQGVARPSWLERPGEQDITSHVDFSSIEEAARSSGADIIALLDQTYFLLGLAAEVDDSDLKTRLALKTLVMPGGLGSTLKVLILAKNVGTPSLLGCSFGVRLT